MSQNETASPETSGQGAQASISAIPTIDSLLTESEDEYLDVARSSDDDGGSDSELVFNLFIEGEPPESIGESGGKEVQVAPTTADARTAEKKI